MTVPMRKNRTTEQRFAGWWSWDDEELFRDPERFLPHPHAYAGEAIRRKGESHLKFRFRGGEVFANDLLHITPLDASSFVVSFPQSPWAKNQVIVFRLPWDEREPVKAFFYRIKRCLTEYLQERSIKKQLQEKKF